jgi:hypothetical protein
MHQLPEGGGPLTVTDPKRNRRNRGFRVCAADTEWGSLKPLRYALAKKFGSTLVVVHAMSAANETPSNGGEIEVQRHSFRMAALKFNRSFAVLD